MKYSILFLLLLAGNHFLFAGPAVIDNHIKIDQFGYRPGDEKIAVISNPQTGYNSNSPFTPGNVYQVKRWNDDAVVYSGTITSWNNGNTHTQSGDKVWWFNFSSVTTPGSYYVYDSTRQAGSYRFEIDDCVYNDVLKHIVRSFYYQRCGTPKALPNAEVAWADGACHTGTQQDNDCRLYNNTNSSTSRDLSGGWHDAGDYNKYINFAYGTLIDLLLAYEENPAVWKDDYNIPESGNGIPDLLDEIKYELDWFLKMQNSDGSVLCVIGGGSGSPPSADTQARRYGPATTSASLTAASVLALGSIQFKSAGMTTYASTLQTAAEKAWTWANNNPNVTFNNSGVLAAGEQEVDNYGRLARKVAASCYLYALTGNSAYKTFFENNYTQIHMMQWSYVYPFEAAEQDALVYYTKLPGITASIGSNIRNVYQNSVKSGNADNLPAYTDKTDAYRAYLSDNNYTWGSNTTKGHQANLLYTMNIYGMDAVNAVNYSNASLGYINYMHGVNPTAFAYITNMGNHGAENSINEVYHGWFHDGSTKWDRAGVSTYGPAPGFLPGGANPSWKLDGCCPSGCGSAQNNALCISLSPPSGQPIQKSYHDWNTSWPQNSWEITEPGIYTQAAYVRALSKFVPTGNCIPTGPEHAGSDEPWFSVYPNPFTEQIGIRIHHQEESSLRIELQDVSGRIIKSATAANIGSGYTVVEAGDLAQGIYFIRITGQNGTFARKIIRQ